MAFKLPTMLNLSRTWRTVGCVAAVSSLAFVACNDEFLEPEVPGQLTSDALQGPAGIEGAVIAAYAQLSGLFNRLGGSYNWVSGAIRGGDANKGTEAGDFVDIEFVVNYSLDATSALPAAKWQSLLEGVSRANAAATIAMNSTDERVTDEFRANMIAQATFLRGHYFFELQRHFGKVPYFTELDDPLLISSIVAENAIERIEADFRAAVEGLPETQSSVGMVNKTAAKAYLGKVLIYQEKWDEAASVLQDVVDNGVTSNGTPVALVDDYSKVFNAEFDNNSESIFAIQAAANTGSASAVNANYAFDLAHLQNSPVGGCCGFWQPSFDLVNSFRTEDGLPLLDLSYRDDDNLVTNDLGVAADAEFALDDKPVDPRLDHSVGRRGVPYLDWGPHPGASWIRSQPYGGPFSPKKFIYYQSQTGTLQDGSSWTSGYTAINFNIIRLADVMLLLAEARAETGDLEAARELVNQIRARAANEDSFVRFEDGSLASNYEISLYEDEWDNQSAALEAIYFERKLELNNEGERFFDLVRWGRDVDFINGYIDFEAQFIPDQFRGASYEAFEALLPIPQGQIDLQGTEILSQNEGYR